MRKILGPAILAALALVSLLFLQHQKSPHPATPAATTTTTTSVPSPPVTATAATPPVSPTPTTSSTAPTDAGGNGEVEGTPVPSTATPAPANSAQATQWADATKLAVAFMKAFARPSSSSTSAATWWAKVKPYLTPQAAADYDGTDPANVPFTAVTGAGVIVVLDAADSEVTAVRVPTNAGPYLVEILSGPDGSRVTRATREAGR